MKILDGKKIAGEIKMELRQEIARLKSENIWPGLAVILVGDDEASKIYVRHKEKACQELGIRSEIKILPSDIDETRLMREIEILNARADIHGILVQLPLPKNVDERKIVWTIAPEKDIDCFHPENLGKLFLGFPRFEPCTPAGILEILRRSDIPIAGRQTTIVGRSKIVGKPLAAMLINESATVTVCHSKTVNLDQLCRQADILISAVGHIGLITPDMVKPNAVVIDVGINRNKDGKVTGDVEFEKVKEIAQAITPVPGGVGPMTIAMLMKNTLKAAKDIYADSN